MSDLQLSLLAIGTVVVAGVYLFNWWQERRLRRHLHQAFGAERDDVLLRTQAAPAERVEPQLQSVPAEQPESDPEPETAQPAVESHEPTQARPVPAVPWFDETLDCIAELHAAEPIPEAVLAELLSKAAAGGKPWRAAGYDEERGEWDELAQAGSGYARARLALQLVTRNGAVTAPQVATFCAAVHECGDKAGADARCPEAQAVLNRAHDLDAFCADVDVAIGLNIVAAAGASFPGSKIRACAESAGFKLAPDGVFHYPDDAGRTLFTLDNHEPLPFIPEQIKNLSSTGLTLLLDVPRVPEPQQVLTIMVQAAQTLARALGGRLVDDNRVVLNPAGIAKIKQQLEGIATTMAACGVPPGGERALRLFS